MCAENICTKHKQPTNRSINTIIDKKEQSFPQFSEIFICIFHTTLWTNFKLQHKLKLLFIFTKNTEQASRTAKLKYTILKWKTYRGDIIMKRRRFFSFFMSLLKYLKCCALRTCHALKWFDQSETTGKKKTNIQTFLQKILFYVINVKWIQLALIFLVNEC